MKDEVFCATEFVVGFVQKADDVTCVAVDEFKKCFAERLRKKYLSHWHPQQPYRGSAYRSIIIDHDCVDPLITGTLKDLSLDSKLRESILKKLPKELTLWVDPADVSYRFGDHGSVGVLYTGPRPEYTTSESSAEEPTSDYESDLGSATSSPCSSPPRSPYDYRQQQTHSIHRPTQCRHEMVLGNSPFPSRYYYYNRMETTVA